MRIATSLVLLACAGTLQCGRAHADYRAQPPDPELLHAAVDQVTHVMVYDIFSPPQASRVYAYASIAAYEALRPDHPAQQTLAGQLHGLTPVPAPTPGVEYYLPLSAVHAYMTVGRALTFSRARMDSLRAAMDERFRALGLPRAVFERSVAYGEAVAKHVLSWASQDHYLQTRGEVKYSVTDTPGRWIPTPPAYMDAVEPHWGELRPFLLDSGSEFRPKPHPRYDMTPGSPFFRETKEVMDVGNHMSAEQREIAAFWDCNPYVMNVQGHAMFATKKVTPGGHWMGITRLAARQTHADLMRTAEAYARAATAVADGFISAWDEKYHSNRVRPETVIDASLQKTWQPLLQTPPFPEYPSAHSVISNAAAVVLTDEFGPGFTFLDSTEVEYGLPPRSFTSFQQAAAEAAISRLYGGIHYRSAVEEGAAEGIKVGELALRRVHTRGAGSSLASH